MKKILLATTVLAAVSVVTPAIADVTVGGYYRFGWQSYSDDSTDDTPDADGVVPDEDSFTNNSVDSEVNIIFSKTTDTGLTFGATFEFEGDTGTADNTDEASLTLSGDFGKLVLGENDNAHASFLTWAPTGRGTFGDDSFQGVVRFTDNAELVAASVTALEGIAANAAGKDEADAVLALLNETDTDVTTSVAAPYNGHNVSYGDDVKIAYFSPDLSGFKFGISGTDDKTGSTDVSWGVSYEGNTGDMMDDNMMSGLTYKFTASSFDDGENDGVTNSAYGVKLGYNDLTVTASAMSGEDGATETDATEFGVGLKMSDQLTIGAAYAVGEDSNSGDELEVTSLSAAYTIAPGLVATAAYSAYDASTGISSAVSAYNAAANVDGVAAEAITGTTDGNNEGTSFSLSVRADF